MKINKCDIYYWTYVVFVLYIGLMICSWIGGLYELPVRNMLSPEGIRWVLQSMIPNVENSLWLVLFVLTMGVGVCMESGWFQACWFAVRSLSMTSVLSRKRRQALLLSSLFLLVYVLVILFATFSRYEILLGVTGTLYHSPFYIGMPFLVSLGMGLTGGIYGLASGKFREVSDVFRSMSVLPVTMVGYFIYLFWVVQFLAAFHYACFDTWLGLVNVHFDVLYFIICYIPLVIILLKHFSRK